MKKINMKSGLNNTIDICLIIFAGIIYAVALKYLVLPSKIILTGTEGIASSLSYFYDSERLFLYLYIGFQFLILTFGFFKVSKQFAVRSFITVFIVVLFLRFLPDFQFAQPESQNERIILVIFGGLLAGVAKALAFKHRGSTGDEDIIGAFFAMKLLKPVGFVSVIAAIVSTTFGIVLDIVKTETFEVAINTLMYTSIYIFIAAETLNNLYKKFQITLLTIMTDDPEKIGELIKETLDYRTYTGQTASGGHSKTEYQMIKTIITREELPELLRIIDTVYPECFYYYHDIEGTSRKYFIRPIG